MAGSYALFSVRPSICLSWLDRIQTFRLISKRLSPGKVTLFLQNCNYRCISLLLYINVCYYVTSQSKQKCIRSEVHSRQIWGVPLGYTSRQRGVSTGVLQVYPLYYTLTIQCTREVAHHSQGVHFCSLWDVHRLNTMMISFCDIGLVCNIT